MYTYRQPPMSAKAALDSPAAAVGRRQPLLTTKTLSSPTPTNNRIDAKNCEGSCGGSRMGQTAGECAAVCCCCPFAVLHLLILAVYRLPRGLWRKKKKKRLLKKKRKISSEEKANHRISNSIGYYGGDEEEEEEASTEDEDCGRNNDVVDWDNEMWDRFYGAGFWRSASQRKDDDE